MEVESTALADPGEVEDKRAADNHNNPKASLWPRVTGRNTGLENGEIQGQWYTNPACCPQHQDLEHLPTSRMPLSGLFQCFMAVLPQ